MDLDTEHFFIPSKGGVVRRKGCNPEVIKIEVTLEHCEISIKSPYDYHQGRNLLVFTGEPRSIESSIGVLVVDKDYGNPRIRKLEDVLAGKECKLTYGKIITDVLCEASVEFEEEGKEISCYVVRLGDQGSFMWVDKSICRLIDQPLLSDQAIGQVGEQ